MVFYLLTGGTGYLASNLIKHFTSEKVFILDRTVKLDRITIQKENFLEKPLELINKDDLPSDLEAVIHTSYCKNINSEIIFFELLKQINPNIRIIFFSSSAVYGDLFDTEKKFFKTSDTPSPINYYGKYKLSLENFIKNTFHNFQILRISNPYGKEFEIKGVYQLFKNQIKKSLETNYQASFTINYPRAQTMFRDMIFIDDAIKQIVSILQNKESGIYNISSGKPLYLEQIAYLALNDFCQERYLKTSKFKLNFVYRDKPEGEIIQSVLEPIPYELYLPSSYYN
jgi:nucleoside-diphosphate-sugar epimerase